MAIELKPLEIRVLGVLIEKSMTNADTYPLTLNSLTLGCNQKTNRDPVLSLSEGEVAAAVHELQQWQLVSFADTPRGSRANRFRHEVEQRFGWNAVQRAVMAELMIRGPQTLGELRTHVSRMIPPGDIAYLTELLGEFEKAEPPMVRELPRQPGQSTTRWAQLLGGPVNVSHFSAPAAQTSRPEVSPEDEHAHTVLGARIDQLTAEVSDLKAQLAQLRSLIERGVQS
ncbi:MAG: DUF480 domain-containing protein [Planctomycetia bacterium]|nr:DUF480 domain-containing protein [Planctomycetia bacterium]MCC7314621.1 DUF480 domain-containing protein [Planctomycetota bacterium]